MSCRCLAATLVLAGLVLAAPASAADGWLTPAATLSGAMGNGARSMVASNARGDTVVAWVAPSTQKVFATDRPAGGTFSPAVEISSQAAQSLGSVAVDASGLVYVFYSTDTGTASTMRPRVATRQAGASTWGVTPLAVASSADPPSGVIGAVAPSGQAIAVWLQAHTAGNEFTKLQFSTKPAGSTTWSAKLDVTGACGCGSSTATPQTYALATNATGDAALVFSRYNAGFVDLILMGQTLKVGQTTWTTPSQISASGGSVSSLPVVAIDNNGLATAAWTRNNPVNSIVQYSSKTLAAASWPQAPGGTTMTPGGNDLSALGADAGKPAIANGPDGRTTIAWDRSAIAEERTRAPLGSGFSVKTTLPDALTSAFDPVLAVNPSGEFVAAWVGSSSGHQTIAVARRAPAAASFSAIDNVPGSDNVFPAVAIDDQGNIAAAWNTGTGPYAIQASGFDVGAPIISNVSLPATAIAGQEFAYSASATDRWSPVTASWAFGDGITGPLSGTHTYTVPGSFLAALTATDAFGHSASTSQVVQVAAAPTQTTPVTTTGGDATGTPPAAGPSAAPVITGLTLSPTKFRAAGRGGSTAAAAAGSTVRYTVSEQSTTTFTVQRSLPGVRKGSRCVAPPKRAGAKQGKACKRWVKVRGSFTHVDSSAGPVSFTFTGRLGGKKLVPGSYRLVAVGSNAKGKGKAARRAFKIVRK